VGAERRRRRRKSVSDDDADNDEQSTEIGERYEMAKKHPPGWKPKDKKQNTVGVQIHAGEDAQKSVQALLERMEKNPENFVFGGSWSSEDTELW
jgi:hypothetical protein